MKKYYFLFKQYGLFGPLLLNKKKYYFLCNSNLETAFLITLMCFIYLSISYGSLFLDFSYVFYRFLCMFYFICFLL